MQITNDNPRRNFLKKIPVAIISISAFSFLKVKKSKNYPENTINTLSKSEAEEIIKSEKFTVQTQLKPALAPIAQKNING